MRAAPILLSPQRRTRIISWARLVLLWVGAALLDTLPFNRRHIRQRYRWLGLDSLADMVCMLAVIRAVELAQLTPQTRRPYTHAAPPGFRRKAIGGKRRSMIGARLRAWFKHKDMHVRMARLREALADLDGFARAHVLRRIKRRLTKLRPLVALHPPAQAFTSAAAPAPRPANSS